MNFLKSMAWLVLMLFIQDILIIILFRKIEYPDIEVLYLKGGVHMSVKATHTLDGTWPDLQNDRCASIFSLCFLFFHV